jgi:hypothetical protein
VGAANWPPPTFALQQQGARITPEGEALGPRGGQLPQDVGVQLDRLIEIESICAQHPLNLHCSSGQ